MMNNIQLNATVSALVGAFPELEIEKEDGGANQGAPRILLRSRKTKQSILATSPFEAGDAARTLTR